VVPQDYQYLKFTTATPEPPSPEVHDTQTTIILNPSKDGRDGGSETSSNMGVEAYMTSASIAHSTPKRNEPSSRHATNNGLDDPNVYLPKLLAEHDVPDDVQSDAEYIYIPILALRRQRTGDEERYHEDPGVVDVSVTFCDSGGNPVMPDETDDDEDEGGFSFIDKSKWTRASFSKTINKDSARPRPAPPLGSPMILVKRNVPIGFADAAFATSVLDRFPLKNYKDLPLPEEELPMFCYPTGCRLFRVRYSDAPLPQYYGFVVKNERGDSIHGEFLLCIWILCSDSNRCLNFWCFCQFLVYPSWSH
jgi:hypothetical protein